MNRLAAASRPYYCTEVIRQCIKKGLISHPPKYGAQAIARGIDMPVSQMSSQFADMARVRNTPQPECFRVMLHMFTIVYLLLLPVISYDYIGYWIIPEGTIRLDPPTHRCTDVPTYPRLRIGSWHFCAEVPGCFPFSPHSFASFL